MQAEILINKWFKVWMEGDFQKIPVSDTFKHTSPFGTITGKKAYLELVETNKDNFLGYKFEILDEIYGESNACVRYKATQGKEFKLDVSEWYYIKNGLIQEIVAYYHIGEIREDRNIESY